MTNSHRTLIIAEAGVNHNGSLELALRLIDAAAEAGADVVKFQTFKAARLATANAPKAEYQRNSTGDAESQLQMLKRLELSKPDHEAILQHCRRRNVSFMSTPFDEDSLKLLMEINVQTLKFGSGDITNAPLLLAAAQTGKPIILSTGMSTLGEVEQALSVLAFGYTNDTHSPVTAALLNAYGSATGRDAVQKNVVLLHCTTEYPAPFKEVNLRAMDTLREAFGVRVGYSDHTPGIAVTIAAAARGASVIEKHFTLDRNLPGPDHKASLEPAELASMVRAIREVELCLGDPIKSPAPSELKNLPIARKSLVADKAIQKGEPFTTENLAARRPGSGISPMLYWSYLGRTSDRDYAAGELIR